MNSLRKQALDEILFDHLKNSVASEVNIKFLESLPPDKPIGMIPGPIAGSKVGITAKEAIENHKQNLRGNLKFMGIIGEMYD